MKWNTKKASASNQRTGVAGCGITEALGTAGCANPWPGRCEKKKPAAVDAAVDFRNVRRSIMVQSLLQVVICRRGDVNLSNVKIQVRLHRRAVKLNLDI